MNPKFALRSLAGAAVLAVGAFTAHSTLGADAGAITVQADSASGPNQITLTGFAVAKTVAQPSTATTFVVTRPLEPLSGVQYRRAANTGLLLQRLEYKGMWAGSPSDNVTATFQGAKVASVNPPTIPTGSAPPGAPPQMETITFSFTSATVNHAQPGGTISPTTS